MPAKLRTTQDLFQYKLGAALKMENTVLRMLGELEKAAQEKPLKQQFRHHAQETRGQIRNIEKAFTKLGEKAATNPCPAIEGIEREGKATMRKAEDTVLDAVLLAGAAETEHHEIAVYEDLIGQAEAMGQGEVARLLRENLEQEQHTLEEVTRASREFARQQAVAA
jgi:ferritin-like metal-binding protein YciE